MCQQCFIAVHEAIKNGIEEKDAIDWLWSNTAFPFDPPTDEQMEELKQYDLPRKLHH